MLMNKSKERLGGRNLLKIITYRNSKKKIENFLFSDTRVGCHWKELCDEIKTRA